MAGDHQPFTDYVTKSSRRANRARWGWITAGVLAALLVVAVTLWISAAGKARALQALQGKLDEAAGGLAAAQDQNQTNLDLIASLQSEIAGLQQQEQASTQTSKGLEDEMRDDLQSKDVTISNLQGRLTVTILDQVMFNSGEADLKPDGQAVMRKVAGFLADHPDIQIQIIGYTDNMPIRPIARSRFASNWELSTARALAAVHFLTEQAGVDPRRVGAAGYGEFRPVADNGTAAGRAKNRRIEIAVLPFDFVGPNPASLSAVSATASAPAITKVSAATTDVSESSATNSTPDIWTNGPPQSSPQ